MVVKLLGILFGLIAIILAIVSAVYGFIFAWQCFVQLFTNGGAFELAKHALIVWFACGLSAKISGAIGKGLLDAKLD